jgi:cytochrome c-type biogenesis protein CcmE
MIEGVRQARCEKQIFCHNGHRVALMLNAFRDSIVFFNSPSDVAEKRIAAGTVSGYW